MSSHVLGETLGKICHDRLFYTAHWLCGNEASAKQAGVSTQHDQHLLSYVNVLTLLLLSNYHPFSLCMGLGHSNRLIRLYVPVPELCWVFLHGASHASSMWYRR